MVNVSRDDCVQKQAVFAHLRILQAVIAELLCGGSGCVGPGLEIPPAEGLREFEAHRTIVDLVIRGGHRSRWFETMLNPRRIREPDVFKGVELAGFLDGRIQSKSLRQI